MFNLSVKTITARSTNRRTSRQSFLLMGAVAAMFLTPSPSSADEKAIDRYKSTIQPLLVDYCYDCHGDGEAKGGVAFDELESSGQLLEDHELWLHAIKLLRTDIMPPSRKTQPSDDEKKAIAEWVKESVFKLDPENPDPGRVTVRRLNRVEYRNTIRDLVGVDFDTAKEFPPDDSGHGFDNIADVLTISPMLLEKYLDASKSVIGSSVPLVSGVPRETITLGSAFEPSNAGGGTGSRPGTIAMPYYSKVAVSNILEVPQTSDYRLVVDLTAVERYVDNQFDYNKCRLIFKLDGEMLLEREFAREGGKPFEFEFDQKLQAGKHELVFEVEPLTPDERQVRALSLRVNAVKLLGPMSEEHFIHPEGYEKFFPREVPEDEVAQRTYAAELLSDFATRAYRRPADDATVERLVGLAEAIYAQSGKTFEAGIAQSMTAILASPRFLFREEVAEPLEPGEKFPKIDEYSLASRLSYFLWSSMPDAELMQLAGENQLRANLDSQVKRMLADPRSQELMKNFTGQWLQARDIATVPIIAKEVLAHEAPPHELLVARFKELRGAAKDSLTDEETADLAKVRAFLFPGSNTVDLTPEVRTAMQQETEKVFEYILREDRSLTELLDSDYTFANSTLAKHYGLADVDGDEVKYVALPPDSSRGGILTQGTVLAVTSNPTRTSPVKRGVFILENILGTPPAPPPPNIPALEESAKGANGGELTLRETLALHREKPLCSSCHNRMDPLGLSLEHFNAMGMWRDQEAGQPIDVNGTLISGESFTNVRELKQILVSDRKEDFYHCLTEKMMTYALGRGVEYYDVQTEDEIVEGLLESNGRPSILLLGIINSAPFQRTRLPAPENQSAIPPRSEQLADIQP
jgi:mono/diheme cytochrome c family protein